VYRDAVMHKIVGSMILMRWDDRALDNVTGKKEDIQEIATLDRTSVNLPRITEKDLKDILEAPSFEEDKIFSLSPSLE
jgi:hypothetical protein